jgi:hypothetical protein
MVGTRIFQISSSEGGFDVKNAHRAQFIGRVAEAPACGIVTLSKTFRLQFRVPNGSPQEKPSEN